VNLIAVDRAFAVALAYAPMVVTCSRELPRIVVAGLAGDSGKTLVSLGLLLLAGEAGLPVAAFKKGPDYIDAAWLTWASRRPCRHLDTYLMGPEKARLSFCAHAEAGGLNVIEGNRGIYDGFDASGTHSTAELAKLLGAPVLLVLNATKMTRTGAALVLGCQTLDPDVPIAGVILNQVSSRRHEQVLRQAVEASCGVPVVGMIPRAKGDAPLPGRHLGLVTPEEHPGIAALKENLLALVHSHLDVRRILEIARSAPALTEPPDAQVVTPDGCGLKIGYLRDSAFTFYYPENLEAIERSRATLIPISALSEALLPDDLDALYIGGGFPETHGALLAGNQSFLRSVAQSAANGLPIYAECGGLMLLARALTWRGRRYPMTGVLPVAVEVCDAWQGHGYMRMVVDTPNPFFPVGIELRGHEFHYSHILPEGQMPPTACAVMRGTGSYPGRDGVILNNVWASYAHLHAVATPQWAVGLLAAARRHAGVTGRIDSGQSCAGLDKPA
jgi:cobyrinic acid a,c-diamide synthase